MQGTHSNYANLIQSAWFHRIMLAALVCALVGCENAYEASVNGMVTLDGSPVPSGVIAFFPKSGGPSAYARSDKSGYYTVYTGSEQGLPPGEYGVTVVARDRPEKTHTETGAPNPGKQLTPAWYKSAVHTPLSFEVQSGANDIDLELTTDPPPDWKPPKSRRR